MDTYLPILIAVVLLLVLGFVQIRLAHNMVVQKYKELEEYSQKFDAFATPLLKGSFDGDLYKWLTLHVNHIHQVLGNDGYYGEFTKPYTREVFYNYAIIPNLLSELRKGDERTRSHMIMMCDDALLRGMGTIKQGGRELEAERRNPLIWLREGVRFVATLPIRLFLWLGLRRESSFEEASGGVFGRILTLAAWLIGLLAAIIQIAQTWGPLMAFFGFEH